MNFSYIYGICMNDVYRKMKQYRCSRSNSNLFNYICKQKKKKCILYHIRARAVFKIRHVEWTICLNINWLKDMYGIIIVRKSLVTFFFSSQCITKKALLLNWWWLFNKILVENLAINTNSIINKIFPLFLCYLHLIN